METVIGGHGSVIPAARAWHWYVNGLRLWRRHFVHLSLLSLAPLLLEGVLQAIPLFGVALSKVIVPMFGFGVWRGLADAERLGMLPWSSLWAAWMRDDRWRALGLAAWSGLIVFGVQQLVVATVYGWPAVDAVLLGHMQAHPVLLNRTFNLLLILPGIPVAVLLGLAPMFLLFRSVSPWTAVRRSIAVVCRNPAPFALYAAVQLLMMSVILLVPFGMLAVLPWAPWAMASSYVIWGEVRMAQVE